MIDVMIIAYNEALNLPACLTALDGWANRIFVIDSGSTDGTQDIAREHNATIVHHDWEGYARQKNWGLDNLEFESEWILILDADEVITPALRDQLIAIAKKDAANVPENGFYVNRILLFMGQQIKHCGYHPNYNMRFFKRGKARYEDRAVHEHMIIDQPLGYIREPMIHEDRRGLEHYVAKHNRYSTLEARAIFSDIEGQGDRGNEDYLTGDTKRRRWLKRNVTPYIPAPGVWRFLYMYIFRLGILDGRAGLDFCRFIAFYDNMVALKLKELRRMKRAGKLDSVPQPGEGAGLAIDEGELGSAPTEGRWLDAAKATGSPTAEPGVGEVEVAPASTTTVTTPAAAPAANGTAPAPALQPAVAATADLSPEAQQMTPESSPWSFTEKLFRVIWMLAGRPLFRLSFHNWYGFRAMLLRLFGAKIGRDVRIRPSVHVEIPWNLDIRDGVTVGDHAILYSLGKITVGERTIISQYAHICAGTHDHTDRTFPLIRDPINVGPDAWIGADAFVGPNVVIGELSVLGARSSAYKALEPQTVYVGNPARPLKKRVMG